MIQRYLRELRIASGQKQTELSALMGRPQSFISDVERGKRRLDLLELRELCSLMGVDFVDAVSEIEARIGREKCIEHGGLHRA
jgi:transcriptional regulator with XRE-family HTH domain